MYQYLLKCATNGNVRGISKLFGYFQIRHLYGVDGNICFESLDHTALSQLSKSRDLIQMIPAPAWQKSAISHTL